MVEDLLTWLQGFGAEHGIKGLRAFFTLVLALVVARFVGRWLRRLVGANGDAQRAELVGRLSSWGVIGLGLAWSLQELGFQLGVLLGAAGVLTVAIGFASQTTLSNLISGFFLFGERPFTVGDVIEVEAVTGEVLSVDMMSTKLRTFDNRYVRIPNETIIKTKVVNYTRYPIRRLELTLRIAYQEDFERVRAIVLDVLDDHRLVLAEPAPAVFIARLGEFTPEVRIWAWVTNKDYGELQTGLLGEIQRVFSNRRITLLASPVTAPVMPSSPRVAEDS
jgi:small-conductance mechanosensitive channel